MQEHDLWNHNNYAVPPENLALLEACLTAIMPWELWVKRPDMLGFRFVKEQEKGMVFFRPAKPAGQLAETVERLRKHVPDLDAALRGMEDQPADYNDHSGFIVKDVEEWETRLRLFHKAEQEHPEWKLKVVTVLRPDDPEALSKSLYQAWLRIGLLGPLRNTFEMQCRNPAVAR